MAVRLSYRLVHDPFGMITVGRNWTSGNSYRYGFNGKEQDPETYGNGNIYDYGFRIYNLRLGKFLSVDPLTRSYPFLTPYQFSSNRPIDGIDLDGLEYLSSDEARFNFNSGKIMLNTMNNGRVIRGMWNDYIWALPLDIALEHYPQQQSTHETPKPFFMGNYSFKSAKIEIGEMDFGFVNPSASMEDLPEMPNSIGPNEKLAEHHYKEPIGNNQRKVGKTSRPVKLRSGSTVYSNSKGVYTANKYLALAEAATWAVGPVKYYFAHRNYNKAADQADIYSDYVLNDIAVAFTNNVIDNSLVSNAGYISDVANWLLYGETNFKGGIYGMSETDYSDKVKEDAKRIFTTISMRNIVKPEAKPKE